MTGRSVVVCVAAALTLGACSGDDDAQPSTTLLSPVTDVTTSTTLAVPPPTVPESTEPAPETSPPTLPGEPTTTDSSTPPDDDQIKQDVIDATIASWTAFNELMLDPENDDHIAAVAEVLAGTALDRAVELAVSYRANSQAERTNLQYPARVHVAEESVDLDLAAFTASVQYCRLGSNIWVEVGGEPDGSDRVLDDTINSYLERDSFSLVDGGWVKVAGVTVAKYEGELECPPVG